MSGFPVKTGIRVGTVYAPRTSRKAPGRPAIETLTPGLGHQAEEVASETTSEGGETVEGFHGEDNT